MTDPYDDVVYPGACVPLAHPSRLFVAAHLHAVSPAPVARARILEIGCGTGDHLLPIAARLPEARCVGIDRATTAIATARRHAEALGANVALVEVDIADAEAALRAPDLPEAYDYIVAHGVYSWVPEGVQDQLLALFARWLAPKGVAYVSYNALPGWHLRGMVGQMMRFHAEPDAPPDLRIRQSRALVDWLAEVVPESDPYGAWLRKEADLIDEQPDGWLFHDLLAPENRPALLSDVVRRARSHDLHYLADADLPAMSTSRLPKEVRETLSRLGEDPVTLEQYLDFVLCRSFRRSLFVGRTAAPVPRPDWARVPELHVRGLVEAQGLVGRDGTEAFRNRAGEGLRTAQPVLRAAFHNLIDEGPATVSFDELLKRVRDETGDDPDLRRSLARHLLVAFQHELVELTGHPVAAVAEVSRHPTVDPVARKLHSPKVPNLHHRPVPVDALDQVLLPRLDGTRMVPDVVR
ncbi:MAG: class I SAM-dependent methyltransferase, partial [Myxococcota bacterium]